MLTATPSWHPVTADVKRFAAMMKRAAIRAKRRQVRPGWSREREQAGFTRRWSTVKSQTHTRPTLRMRDCRWSKTR